MQGLWEAIVNAGSQWMPHGMCYSWNPWAIWLHVVSDGMIAVAYFSIPLLLTYFLRQSAPLSKSYRDIFILFSSFITWCGITHVFNIIIIWYPIYWTEGVAKLITGSISLFTAYTLTKAIPLALKLPEPRLTHDVFTRVKSEFKILSYFIIGAVFLIIVVYASISSLNLYTKTVNDISTQSELIASIESMNKSIVALQSSSRGYILTNDPVFLNGHQKAINDVRASFETVRRYNSDPENQQDIDKISSLIEEKIKWDTYVISRYHSEGIEAARKEIQTGAGTEIVRTAWNISLKMQERSRAILNRDIATSEKIKNRNTVWFTGISLIGFTGLPFGILPLSF